MGPREGPAISVHCPIWDSLRGGFLWLVLFGLLMRKPNRTRQAWLILFPLLMVYLIFCIVLSKINSSFIRHPLEMNIYLILCESLKIFALSLAVLLTISDLIKVRSGLLRFLLVFFVLFLAAGIGTSLNVPAIFTPGTWTAGFGVLLLIFMVGHKLIAALLRRLFRERFTWLYAGFYLVLGICPILIIGGIVWIQGRSTQVLSPTETFRALIFLFGAVSVPYFVFFCFALLALVSPFYRRRFANCFAHQSI